MVIVTMAIVTMVIATMATITPVTIMMVMIGSPKPVTPTYPADHPLTKVKRG